MGKMKCINKIYALPTRFYHETVHIPRCNRPPFKTERDWRAGFIAITWHMRKSGCEKGWTVTAAIFICITKIYGV